MSVLIGPAGLGILGTIDQFLQTVLQFSVFSLPREQTTFRGSAVIERVLRQRVVLCSPRALSERGGESPRKGRN